jgi:hypothetical protein
MSLLDIKNSINKKIIITSPRSCEALNRLGILNEELWPKTDKEIKEYYGVYNMDK